MRAKDFWADNNTAKEWIKRVDNKSKIGDVSENTTIQSMIAILDEVGLRKTDFDSILEVGAGEGRIIGAISNIFPHIKCYSDDINAELSKFVNERFPIIESRVGEIIKLPFEDNEVDLVFTHQVLQHVCPEEMEQAIKELLRVAKKEVWLIEGYDQQNDDNESNGILKHPAEGGTYSWFFDRLPYVNCYEVKFLESETFLFCGHRKGEKIYRIKK
jgi:ubiquinone/menaquinone biosynthesis C-methylase UbiE